MKQVSEFYLSNMSAGQSHNQCCYKNLIYNVLKCL